MTSLACVLCGLGVGLASYPARAESPDMRTRIAEVRKKLEAERALPEDKRWELEESQVRELEERASGGDSQSAQFLELARIRMAKLRRDRLISKWGRALNDPDIGDELREHARRTAQLKRIRLLALERAFPGTAARADELLAAERARHEQQMQTLVAALRSGSPSEPSDERVSSQ